MCRDTLSREVGKSSRVRDRGTLPKARALHSYSAVKAVSLVHRGLVCVEGFSRDRGCSVIFNMSWPLYIPKIGIAWRFKVN
jgi:hypothetical protein